MSFKNFKKRIKNGKTSNQQPATSNQQPATSNQQPATSNQQKTADYLSLSSKKNQLNLRRHPRVRRGLTPSCKSGFTLVELAITLVIIGLLVGGVLVGKDLISAAEVRAQIQQIEKYNGAVNTFKVKYNYLPGDMPAGEANAFGFVGYGGRSTELGATTTSYTCNGSKGRRDGNGLIQTPYDSFGFASPSYMLVGNEPTIFWADLGSNNANFCGSGYNQPCNGAGLIDFTFLGDISCIDTNIGIFIPDYSRLNSYMPIAKITGNYIYVYSDGSNNYFGLMGVANSANPFPHLNSSFSITPTQAYSIDTKIDDGIASTGSIQASYINDVAVLTCATINGAGCTAPPTSYAPANDTETSCYNTTNNKYSTSINSGNGLNCALSFKFQ